MGEESVTGPSVHDRQRAHLEAVAGWARRIHEDLGALQRDRSDVHFRPGSRGVSMVGLLPARPQRGKSNIRDLGRLARSFEAQFEKHCRDCAQGRATPEKRLQSYLVSNALRHGRRMEALARALADSGQVEIPTFVTDEIVVRPLRADGSGKIVCDLLALRRGPDGERPVIIELKSARMMKELIRQTETYAELMNAHQAVFERIYSALLGRDVRFAGPPDPWIVWPAPRRATRRDEELSRHGITTIEYETTGDGYGFRVEGG